MTVTLVEQFKDYYREMFAAVQANDQAKANILRQKMESLRLAHLENESNSKNDLLPANLPDFVRMVLGKSHVDLGILENSTCINAALNFHSEKPVFTPIKQMQLLTLLRAEFIQIEKQELQPGDLVVFWSRMTDEWKDRALRIRDLDPKAPGFPFGMVFDHVAVFLEKDKLFHKPDPTLTCCYQINDWEDVILFSKHLPGFEMTYHRITAKSES